MVAQYEEKGVNGKCGELTMANLGAVRWGLGRAINGSCIFTGPCRKNKEAAGDRLLQIVLPNPIQNNLKMQIMHQKEG